MKKYLISISLFMIGLVCYSQDKDKFDLNKPTRYTKTSLLVENRYAVGRKDVGIGFHYRANGYAISGDFTYYVSGKIGLNGLFSFGKESASNWDLSSNHISLNGQYVFPNKLSSGAIKPFFGFALGSNKVSGFEIPDQDNGIKPGLSGGIELTGNIARSISINLRAEQFMFFANNLNKYQVGLIIRKTL